MKIKGIDFPRRIVNALRDDKLVVFAGAGVSMGDPANLPSFRGLTRAVARGTGRNLQDGESEDQFLGRLRYSGTDVHTRAKQELSKENPHPTDLHRDLLRLYPKSKSPLIVTTNFDLLFEQAVDGLFDSQPDVFRAPALPLGRKFSGIVHVHGALDRPDEMVLTDADFGRAYLTEGWARSFLVELFRSFTVLFVGYSHNDSIMNYLSRALPVEESEMRFVLSPEADSDRWQVLGIEPIHYPSSRVDGHRALYAGVRGLANHARRSILDWQREITEIAKKPPTLDDEETDLIEDALTDESKTRFFTDVALSVEWVAWLDKRNYLAGLFGTSELSEPHVLLVHWLTEKFARAHSDEIFHLIGRHNMRLHPEFWCALCRNIGLKDNPPLDANALSRWISLLLATIPVVPDRQHLLLWLGKRCNKCKLMESIVDVFDAMAASQLVVKRGFSLPDEVEEAPSPRMDVECAPVSDHYTINEIWTNGLKPNLHLVAETLLATVIGHLTTRHRTLSAWQEANRDSSPVSYNRSAIEPHEQDKYPETIDVLIDAARDCLGWLATNRPKVAAAWSDRLVNEGVPLLRRLAVHTLIDRRDMNPNEKIDWLLGVTDLHDSSAHHELFQLMKAIYPNADEDRRTAVIEAIQAYRQPSVENEHAEEDGAAYVHFNWLRWLHNAAPNCRVAEAALEDVLRRHPDFRPQEHPDLTHWMSSVPGGHQSPWNVDELLSKSAEEWAEKLLSFQDTGINDPDRLGLNIAVSDAAKRDFQWGLELADALAKKRNWDTDLWNTLLRLWSETELDQNRVRQVIQQLERIELQKNRARPIAEFLYKLLTNDRTQHAVIPLTQVNQIAANLWRHVDHDDARREIGSWLTAAINSTAGLLAGFWMHSLNCWRKQQAGESDDLSPDYRDALSEIVEDTSLAGRLGRAVLARYLSFLVGVDRDWTEANLVPFFTNHSNVEDYHAIWNGFLYGPLSPAVAELMEDAFLNAVPRIMGDASNEEQRQFIRRYFTMLANYTDDPLDKWIPVFFKHCDEYARRHFAITIKNHLEDMTDSQQQEWWNRWLKIYWQNRLQGLPEPLSDGEIGIVFCWLPDLKGVFPEAVDLAVQMQLDRFTNHSADSSRVVYMIEKGDLWERHPASVAQLLCHLGRIKSRSLAWPKGKELIQKLLKSDIPCELKRELKELAAERGMS